MSLCDIEDKVRIMRITRKWKALSLNLLFLIQDLKPGFLWDLGSLQIEDLISLKSIINDILIIDINTDYFITSRTKIQQHLTKMVENFPVLVDISGHLSDPIVASDEVEDDMKTMIKEVQIQVSNKETVTMELDIQDGWNISSLYGLLLGFPVVYFYDLKYQSNCLSNQDLSVFKVGLHKEWPISFSVPTNLLKASELNIQQWIQKFKLFDEYKLDTMKETVNLQFVLL